MTCRIKNEKSNLEANFNSIKQDTSVEDRQFHLYPLKSSKYFVEIRFFSFSFPNEEFRCRLICYDGKSWKAFEVIPKRPFL